MNLPNFYNISYNLPSYEQQLYSLHIVEKKKGKKDRQIEKVAASELLF